MASASVAGRIPITEALPFFCLRGTQPTAKKHGMLLSFKGCAYNFEKVPQGLVIKQSGKVCSQLSDGHPCLKGFPPQFLLDWGTYFE